MRQCLFLHVASESLVCAVSRRPRSSVTSGGSTHALWRAHQRLNAVVARGVPVAARRSSHHGCADARVAQDHGPKTASFPGSAHARVDRVTSRRHFSGRIDYAGESSCSVCLYVSALGRRCPRRPLTMLRVSVARSSTHVALCPTSHAAHGKHYSAGTTSSLVLCGSCPPRVSAPRTASTRFHDDNTLALRRYTRLPQQSSQSLQPSPELARSRRSHGRGRGRVARPL